MSAPSRVGVIDRNEGERLRRCLGSVLAHDSLGVYVESGSTDDSARAAAHLGVAVHALHLLTPVTAARARNSGVAQLRALAPAAGSIQFVDGDCEVDPRWIDTGKDFLAARTDVAAVCGRHRERHPERSVYKRLCDMEWDTPVGESKACGGDVMMRTDALREVGGYRDHLIAGEEPELCIRLRAADWKVWRHEDEMTLHDAAIPHWPQSWQRCKRAGFGYAEGVRLHGAPPERPWVREWRSAWFWEVGVPLAVLAVYPLQVIRIGVRLPAQRAGQWVRSFVLVAGKFSQTIGQLKALTMRVPRDRETVIEYK